VRSASPTRLPCRLHLTVPKDRCHRRTGRAGEADGSAAVTLAAENIIPSPPQANIPAPVRPWKPFDGTIRHFRKPSLPSRSPREAADSLAGVSLAANFSWGREPPGLPLPGDAGNDRGIRESCCGSHDQAYVRRDGGGSLKSGAEEGDLGERHQNTGCTGNGGSPSHRRRWPGAGRAGRARGGRSPLGSALPGWSFRSGCRAPVADGLLHQPGDGGHRSLVGRTAGIDATVVRPPGSGARRRHGAAPQRYFHGDGVGIAATARVVYHAIHRA